MRVTKKIKKRNNAPSFSQNERLVTIDHVARTTGEGHFFLKDAPKKRAPGHRTMVLAMQFR